MTVVCVESGGYGRHPLATRRGMLALSECFAASQHWRSLSERQRTALRTAYRQALAAARPGDTVPLPPLPADTHPATARSLTRRGLASGGKLTPLAVEVVRWCGDMRPRPVVDAPAVGGQL